MLRFLIGIGVAGMVAVSPPSRAGEPSYLSVCTRFSLQSVCKEGVASWYGEEFQGNPTASGEPYDMNQLTAAHRELPLGTQIRVTNLRNRRSLVLRITDRGPFIPGRLLDVSRAAARLLGFAYAGKARVRIQVLQFPKESGLRLACPGATIYAMKQAHHLTALD